MNWCSKNQIEANPNKFQVIYSHDSDSDMFTININGSLIKGEPNVKLLGINIDTNLNFNYHISVICKRAAQQLNALKRLSAFLNTNSHLLLYKSFIFSHLIIARQSGITVGLGMLRGLKESSCELCALFIMTMLLPMPIC